MDELFSVRYGHVVNLGQVNSLNRRTRDFLWEELYVSYITEMITDLEAELSGVNSLLLQIDREIFSNSILNSPKDLISIIKSMENAFSSSAWYLCFDIIEAVVKRSHYLYPKKMTDKKRLKDFTNSLNKVLEEEKVMYRLMDRIIVPIINEIELEAISKALSETESFKTVNIHLAKSLDHLANRKNPDYHNSIKEAIQALESLLRLMVNKPSATMGDALKLIQKNKVMSLNPHLYATLNSLYNWSSDEGGIRHSDKGNSALIDIDDAKMTIVTCCSLVNYLVAKSVKGKISLT